MNSSASRPGLLAGRQLAVGYGAGRSSRDRQERAVLTGLDFTLHAGELVCLLGRNGSGKSTLLRTLAGLLSPLGGEVLLGDRPVGELGVRARARRLAVVLQTPPPFGPVTAWEVAALGRYPHTPWNGRLREQDREAVRRALDAVGAMSLAERVVTTLSDGERQKVLIARALAQESPVMLLDEPTAFLDLTARAELMLSLAALAHGKTDEPSSQPGRGLVVSTHDLDLALRCADRLWLVHDGALVAATPERLLADGTLAQVFGEHVIGEDGPRSTRLNGFGSNAASQDPSAG